MENIKTDPGPKKKREPIGGEEEGKNKFVITINKREIILII